jgi:ankyrin repeat protein
MTVISRLVIFSLITICLSCLNNRTPEQLTDELLEASSLCNGSKIKKLIEKGADVNGTGHPSGDRPLRIAAVNGHLDCVKILLEAGADPTLTAKSGSMVFRPVASVQAAALRVKETKKSSSTMPVMDPALQEVMDIVVSEETYDEIIRVLLEAEKDFAGAQPELPLPSDEIPEE